MESSTAGGRRRIGGRTIIRGAGECVGATREGNLPVTRGPGSDERKHSRHCAHAALQFEERDSAGPQTQVWGAMFCGLVLPGATLSSIHQKQNYCASARWTRRWPARRPRRRARRRATGAAGGRPEARPRKGLFPWWEQLVFSYAFRRGVCLLLSTGAAPATPRRWAPSASSFPASARRTSRILQVPVALRSVGSPVGSPIPINLR